MDGTAESSSYKTKGPVCLTKNGIMMNIPVEIVTYYNSKIFVTMGSVDGITSDVIWCENCLIEWYIGIEGLKDKWDVALHKAKLCKLFYCI